MNGFKFEKIDSERLVHAAFDETMRTRMTRYALVRRNVYLWLFGIGMACTLYTAFTSCTTICVLSLFLAIISLVVMTKYDTQLHFLKVVQTREELKNREPDYS